MSITRANADRILALLKRAGGSMSSADLREALSDLEQPERAKAISMLRSGSEIESVGATTSIVYCLPGRKSRRATAVHPPAAQPSAAAVAAVALLNEPVEVALARLGDTSIDRELRFIACLDQLATREDFSELSTTAKIRCAEWLASRLRAGA